MVTSGLPRVYRWSLAARVTVCLLMLGGGSRVGATALQKGLGAELLHIQTRADRAAKEILAAARARRGMGEPDREPGTGRYSRPETITPAHGQGMAVASLVLGIAGLLTSWIFGLNLILAVLATVLGVFALDRANRGVAPGKRAALAGLSCGLAALVLSIVLMIVLYEN